MTKETSNLKADTQKNQHINIITTVGLRLGGNAKRITRMRIIAIKYFNCEKTEK